MPIDKVGRARQDEGKRRLSVFPDEFGSEQHISDVTLWVREKFRLSSVHVCVGRHYGHKDRELSGVTVIASPWHPDPITSAVVEAFLRSAMQSKMPVQMFTDTRFVRQSFQARGSAGVRPD